MLRAAEEFRFELHPVQYDLQHSDWWVEVGGVHCREELSN